MSKLLTGTTVDRTSDETMDAALTESFWAQVSLAAGASDVVLKLNLLTDPKALIVIGGEGVSFKLDSTGTDALGADPLAVVANENDGLGIDEVLLSNADTQSHAVTVIAAE